MSSESPHRVDAPADDWRWRLLAAACIGLALALAAASLWWSRPAPAPVSRDRPTAARPSPTPPAAPASGAHELAPTQIAAMAERLAGRLAREPGDAEGWAMLARTQAVSGRHDKAVEAFRKAAALRPEDAVLLADFADALAMTQGRRIAGEPLQLVQRALELAPDNLKALSLAGTEAFDRGDFAAAVRHWEKLTALGGAESVFVQQVAGGLGEARRRAAAATGGAGRSGSTGSAGKAG